MDWGFLWHLFSCQPSDSYECQFYGDHVCYWLFWCFGCTGVRRTTGGVFSTQKLDWWQCIIGFNWSRRLPSLCRLYGTCLCLSRISIYRINVPDSHPSSPRWCNGIDRLIGGENVHQLGFLYAIMPVFLGSVLLLLVALVVNNLSTDPKRHYPVYWI